MSERQKEAIFLAGLLAALAAVQSIGITRPFLRHHESVCTEFAKHARNHLKFGLGTTLGLRLDVSGHDLGRYENYREYVYPDHPPLPALILAVPLGLFGTGEPVIRGTLMIFTAAAVLLFRALARRLLSPPADRAATLVFAFLPSFAFYSLVTVTHLFTLVGSLAALLFYLRWKEGGRRRDFAGLLASIAGACYCGWFAYYVALVVLAAHASARRPRLGMAASLVAFNVLVFGLYLLHLWAFDPKGLDPLRQLAGVVVDRSALNAPPLGSYVAGELREMCLMLTVPALGLAVAWVAATARGPWTDAQRVIAALPLLGLDEVAFAQVCSGHEYFSYPLSVFVALAAAGGLQGLASRLGRPRTVWLAGLALVLAQSGVLLHRRLTTEGGYAFYHRLGIALDRRVGPRDTALLLTDNIPFFTPYYGDRAVLWYSRRSGELIRENSGGRRPFSPDDVRALLRAPAGFEWVVAAEKDTLLPHVPFLRDASDATLEAFGVAVGRSPWRDLLEPSYGAPALEGGFLFWRVDRR